MNSTLSLDGLLKDEVMKLDKLKLATALLGHRNVLKEQLLKAKLEIDHIAKDMNVMKNYLRKMNEQNEQLHNLSQLLKQLNTKIGHMEENFPAQFPILNYEESPAKENFSGFAPSADRNISMNSISRQNIYVISETPEHCVENCKKTLFKNTEDSWTVDLLSADEFSKIPKYMIGRQSLAALNEFVGTINSVLKAKYDLLALGKEGARKKGKLDLYLSLRKDKMAVAPGKDSTYFFTADDFYNFEHTKLDKVKLNFLTVLRHCKRLRESRVGKNSVYLIGPSCSRGITGVLSVK